MMVLPSGLELPPLPYVVVLLGGLGIVLALLYALDPPITQKHAVAFAPWMMIGGGLHAFSQLGIYPDLWAPLFAAPAVYVTTALIAGVAWIVVSMFDLGRGHSSTVPRDLGVLGVAVLTVLFVLAVNQGIGPGGDLDPVWPGIAVIVALAVSALTMLAISLWRTPVFVRVRYAGSLVVFAHALDGVTTAVGADVLGVTERTPIPKAIMRFAADLPTAEYVGRGWLFVLVKLAVAAAVVVAFNRYVDDRPAEGSLLLAAVAAVGLGPAANNLFLFLIGASPT